MGRSSGELAHISYSGSWPLSNPKKKAIVERSRATKKGERGRFPCVFLHPSSSSSSSSSPVFTHSGWQNICKVTRPVPGLSRLLFWGGGGHHLAIDRGKKRGLRKIRMLRNASKVSFVRQSTKKYEIVANCLVSVQPISFFFCLADTNDDWQSTRILLLNRQTI